MWKGRNGWRLRRLRWVGFLAIFGILTSCGSTGALDSEADRRSPSVKPDGPGSPFVLVIVDFDKQEIGLANTSVANPVSTDNLILCQGRSCLTPDDELVGPHKFTLVRKVESIGRLNIADGELALFDEHDDGSRVMISYVQWGSAGHLNAAEAEERGLWRLNDFVSLVSEKGALLNKVPDELVGSAGWDSRSSKR